jgi:hypothetical protein
MLVWVAWQSLVLFLAFVLFANLFSEYGSYGNPVVDPLAAVVFFVGAVWIGTWLPVRRGGKGSIANLRASAVDDPNVGA